MRRFSSADVGSDVEFDGNEDRYGLKDDIRNEVAESYELKLVPVAEHPLFPGASQVMQLTEEQFEVSDVDLTITGLQSGGRQDTKDYAGLRLRGPERCHPTLV